MNNALASIEDQTLIQMVLEGRSDCFAPLIQRHIAVVTGRMLSEIEDILQEPRPSSLRQRRRASETHRANACE
jgi:hypothetical protein